MPTCASCPSPLSYDKDLSAVWLDGIPPRTRDYLRMDAWGVDVVGLPPKPGGPSGGSSEHPERLVTGLDYKYDRKIWWPKMLEAHRARGYTHWLRWWPDARDDRDFGGGNSIEQFVDDCLLIKTVIPYVVVSLGSKVYDPRDQTADQWKRRVGPILDALLKADAVDELIPAFEMDSFNTPGRPTIDFCKWVGQQAHAAGKSCWVHFFPEHTAWFEDGEPRGHRGFWDDLGADVDGLPYQAELHWDIGDIQARLVDSLDRFARYGHGHKVRAFELTALTQFTHDHPTEAEANAIAYLACCTKHPTGKVWGSGNGAWLLP